MNFFSGFIVQGPVVGTQRGADITEIYSSCPKLAFQLSEYVTKWEEIFLTLSSGIGFISCSVTGIPVFLEEPSRNVQKVPIGRPTTYGRILQYALKKQITFVVYFTTRSVCRPTTPKLCFDGILALHEVHWNVLLLKWSNGCLFQTSEKRIKLMDSIFSNLHIYCNLLEKFYFLFLSLLSVIQ